MNFENITRFTVANKNPQKSEQNIIFKVQTQTRHKLVKMQNIL